MKESIANQIKTAIFEAAAAVFPDVGIKFEDINLEHPAVEEHGDYSSNIALKLKVKSSQFAKASLGGQKSKVAPREIAERIVAQIQKASPSEAVWEKVEIAGSGFINFWLSEEMLLGEVWNIGNMGQRYGENEMGAGKTMVIDYSAPNIAKRFGIGHLRSTIIGQAIYNLYKFSSFKTIGDNHLGDWGTQFGKLLYMITLKKQGNFTLDDLEKWYVEFHEEAEKDPKLEDKGREWFKRLEQGDERARELWKQCVDISMVEFNRIYDLLNVKIDYAYGESFYEGIMGEVIAEAKAKKIVKESQGAWVIEIPGQKTPLLLVKSDGTTTYATRDLATLKFRQKEWNPDLVIYEVGAEQALHFIQLFAAARMLGYVKKGTELVHTKHGLYRWATGKMRTRKGGTIKLEEILNEAIERAKKLGSADEKTAKAVGIGAVKYFDLKHSVQSDIIFDWEKMFALEGDSGPYLQYTYARAKSVLRKSEDQKTQTAGKSEKSDSSDKSDRSGSLSSPILPEELAILRYLYRFPEVVELATKNYSPNLVCTYLFELAKRYNNLYNNCPIIGNDFRLALTSAAAQVLKNGLNLLGIETLERM